MFAFPFLITGDLHVTPRNLETFREWAGFVTDFLKGGTLVVIGDIFDSPDSVKWECLLEVLDFFDHPINFKTILLSGNHDQVFFEKPISTIRAFRNYADLIIETPQTFNNMWFMPSLPERIFLEITETPEFKGEALFMHQMIHSLRLNEHVPAKSSIKFEHLERFRLVFNGHLHKPQILTWRETTVINVGSPWQHSFAEAGQEKFMWLWEGGSELKMMLSPIAERFVEGTFEDIKGKDLKDKNVKIALSSGDNLELIVKVLQEKGASSWVFKHVAHEGNAPHVACESNIDELITQFARQQKLDPDIEALGSSFLEDSE